MLQRRVHVQETGGNPDYYLSFVATTLYVEKPFGGHLSTINITNDSSVDTLQFSFDGASLDGDVKPGESIKINVDQRSSIFVKGTAGGDDVRLWGWVQMDQSRLITTPGNPLSVVVEGISIITFFKEDNVLAAAPSPTVTTIVTQAFVATTFENVVLVEVSGTNYAKFYLKVNGITLATKRTGPNLNLSFDFTGAPYSLIAGDVVTVDVEHFNAGGEDFESTLFGYA